jgi:flagellar basal body-associated protein FliL
VTQIHTLDISEEEMVMKKYNPRGKMQKAVVVLIAVALLFVGCGASQSLPLRETGANDKAVESYAPEAEEFAAEPQEVPADGADYTASEQDIAEVSRMIIYNGDLSLVVKDVESTQEEIVGLVEDADGYVVSSGAYAYGDGLRRASLRVRVPAAQFNAVMEALRDLALDIEQDSISSQDVTQEYVDLESRLTALEAKADRLEELMDQAEDTEAVLAVYEELSETQVRIEETKGRMRFLERSAAMATINIELTPDEALKPVEIAGWRPQGTVKRAVEALIEIFQFLIDALIWIVLVVLPVLLFIGLIIFALIKLLGLIFGRKKRSKSETQASEADAEASEGDVANG